MFFVIGVLEFWIMLGDVSVFSNTNFVIFLCIKFRPLSSDVSSLSIAVIDRYKFDVREEYDDNILIFIQNMREINCLMITEEKN